MRVGVQLDLETARELHQQLDARGGRADRNSRADPVLQATRDLGVTLTPTHPGEIHESLVPFCFVEVPDLATAQKVASHLQHVKGVAGAWVQSAEHLP